MWKRSGGVCEVCQQARAVHLHHRKLRRFDDHTASNLLYVCGNCHTMIHKRPEVSYTAGWLVRSTADPLTTRIAIDGAWYFHDSDGKRRPA